jgi:hypothetical protein
MGKNLRHLLAFIAVWATVLVDFHGSLAALTKVDGDSPVVTVEVFNYSKASRAVLVRARQKVDDLFRGSGIRFAWTDCPALNGSVSSELCQSKSEPGEIRVRVLDRPARKNLTEGEVAFAIQPLWANVYYESVLQLVGTAREAESDVSGILGYLMAHEIAHLLLGQNAHSDNGIMKADWNIQEIRLATRNALAFSPQEQKRMRANAMMRVNPRSESSTLGSK